MSGSSLGLVPAPAAANWGMRYVTDYDAWPTLASYGVPVTKEEFQELADSIGQVKPYYDPFDRLYAHGEVPADLAPARDEAFRRLAELLADLRVRMPEEHKTFLAGLPWVVEHPAYLV